MKSHNKFGIKLIKKEHTITRWATCLLVNTLLLFSFNSSFAQIGEIIWQDNFDTFNAEQWNKDIGDGCDQNLCGWGNQELQSYEENNVYIANIPGENGNKGLVLEAKRENSGSRAYTSGKVTTDNKVAIHYGMIEVRVQVPDLDQGLWPAAWLLGTANLNWPAKGEIDMMEMGFSKEARDFQGATTSTVNTYVGANAFFPIPNNGVGNIAYDVDYNKPYVANSPINDRFLKYRIYWEPTQIRFTVIDNEVEHDLYENPFPIDANNSVTAPFTKPFYMLLNLAVGGTLPGTLDNNSISSPLPGKMYVDYVRVSKWNGHGSVEFSDGSIPEEQGVLGVYTDNTPVDSSLVFGSDAEFYVFGETLNAFDGVPYEGSNVLSFSNDPSKGWFGAGITSLFGKNMSNYVENGNLKFKIKIPANVSFIIGINDNFTNAADIKFPAGQTKYGLVRNGEWGEVSVPIKDFAGLIAFQDMSYLFRIGNDGAIPGSSFEMLIDDIVWEDGNDTTCEPDPITAYYKVNNGNWLSGNSVTINEGDTIVFGPQPLGGSWSWTGPNGFSASSREITLIDTEPNQSGNYLATYVNSCGAQSTKTYTLDVEEVLANCLKTAVNGDFNAQITEDTTGTYLTFIPNVNGVGNNIVIAYYSTNPNSVFPGYIVQPNVPFKINVNSGQQVYFYYTYSLPTGGENNTLNDKMNFTAGECISNKITSYSEVYETVLAFPNPFSNELFVKISQEIHTVKLFDITGKQVAKSINYVNPQNLKYDTSNLQEGIYLLKVYLNSGEQRTFKILKK